MVALFRLVTLETKSSGVSLDMTSDRGFEACALLNISFMYYRRSQQLSRSAHLSLPPVTATKKTSCPAVYKLYHKQGIMQLIIYVGF